MLPEELQTIRERANKATQAPWIADGLGSEGYIIRADIRGSLIETIDTIGFNGRIAEVGYGRDWNELRANAEFLAAAREDVPKLLDEVEQLIRNWNAERRYICGQIGFAIDMCNDDALCEHLGELAMQIGQPVDGEPV